MKLNLQQLKNLSFNLLFAKGSNIKQYFIRCSYYEQNYTYTRPKLLHIDCVSLLNDSLERRGEKESKTLPQNIADNYRTWNVNKTWKRLRKLSSGKQIWCLLLSRFSFPVDVSILQKLCIAFHQKLMVTHRFCLWTYFTRYEARKKLNCWLVVGNQEQEISFIILSYHTCLQTLWVTTSGGRRDTYLH